MRIGIIGGGASGMAAALAAAEKEENQITLLERQSRVGRKLLATGNGRCNLTNLQAASRGYHGTQPEFAREALAAFSPEATLAWFRSIGLLTVAEPSGRVYPCSDQANSVVDVLRYALEKPNIRVMLGFEVEKVRKIGDVFRVESREEALEFDKLIIACGGLAGTKLGGTMAGYKLLRTLGHKCTRLRPTLVQLKTDWRGVAALKGIRVNCYAAIYRDGALWSESTGQLQFTEYGLSGPVIFEISRDVCQSGGNWVCRLDLLPDMPREELEDFLLTRRKGELPASELLTGVLHNRLGRMLVQCADISANCPMGQLNHGEIARVAGLVKDFSVELTEPMGMDSAQVTAGGILTAEFDSGSLESRRVPGLYACGEVLDIDGDCGGYNLQWAWSSGRMAGLHAGGIE